MWYDREKEKKRKKRKNENIVDVLVLATLGLRQNLPFRDVPDVGISAKNIYRVAAGDHRCSDAVDRTALKYIPSAVLRRGAQKS